MTDFEHFEVLDAVSGSDYLTIQSAMALIEPHKLDISQYSITVTHDEEHASVTFLADDDDAGTRKHYIVRQGSEVEFKAYNKSMPIPNANYIVLATTIRGDSLLAINVAETVFKKRTTGLDLTEYRIEVIRERDSLVVTFVDKDSQSDSFGGSGGRPGVEVELSFPELAIRRSNFIR